MDNHGEPLLMSNQELYSVMVQINWTLKTQALANMRVLATQKCSQVAPVPVGGDPPLSDGRGTQSGALLSEQNWRLHACVAGGPSGPLEAVPENALQAGGPGTRGRCAVPLHAAEHTPMRKEICMTGDDTQGGVGQIGASDTHDQSSYPSGLTAPLLSCRGWFAPRGG